MKKASDFKASAKKAKSGVNPWKARRGMKAPVVTEKADKGIK